MTESFRSFRLEALVLRHSNVGEADRILTLFSREQGKVRAVAKGVRKMKSRKAGHLEPITRVQLQIAHGRDLDIITQAEAVQVYPRIRASLDLTAQASYILEIIDRFTYEQESNPEVFQEAADALGRLEEGQEPFPVIRYFELHVLDALGFKPELFSCVNCRKPIQPVPQYFSPAQGGAVCPECATGSAGAQPASVDALRFLRHYQRSRYPEAARACPDGAIQGEIEDLLQGYLHYLLDRQLKTPAFIRAIHHPIK